MPHAPARHGTDWTLLYARHGGRNVAIAQIHLHADTDLDRLAKVVMPAVRDALQRRSTVARVMIVDETAETPEDALWSSPPVSERFLRAVSAWLQVGGTPGQAIDALHPLSVESAARCLFGEQIAVDTARIDADELSSAVLRFVDRGVRPTSLRGCGLLH